MVWMRTGRKVKRILKKYLLSAERLLDSRVCPWSPGIRARGQEGGVGVRVGRGGGRRLLLRSHWSARMKRVIGRGIPLPGVTTYYDIYE